MKTSVSTCAFCLWSALWSAVATAQIGVNPQAGRNAANQDQGGRFDPQPAPGAVGGPGAGAIGGPMGPQSNPMFTAIDADGDGVITTRELRRAVAQLKKLDADQDGNLTLAEVSGSAAPGGQFAPWGDPTQVIDRMMDNDKNGDGKLTAEELPGTMAAQMIQNGDKDGDGALSKQELTQSMEEMRNRFRNAPGGFAPGAGVPGGFQGAPVGGFPAGQGAIPGGPDGEQRQMMGRMMQWDRNGDGRLSGDEVPPQARGMMNGADMNNDNFIDPAEMRAFIEKMNGRFPAGERNFNPRAPRGRNDADRAEDSANDQDARGNRRNP